MNTEYLIYILLALLVGLSYLVLYLIHKVSRQNRILNRPQENYGSSLEIIEGAQKQANAIVEKAVESAKHILFETEYVKQDMAREMQDSLEKVAQEAVKLVQGRSVESEKEFRIVVDEIKADFAKQAGERLAAIEKVTEEEITDFREILRQETIDSQTFIGKKIGQDFEKVQSDLTEYKKIKLLEIDNNIQAITKQVVEEMLGASITLPVHEELIKVSLENAKKTGLFKQLEEKMAEHAAQTQVPEIKEHSS